MLATLRRAIIKLTTLQHILDTSPKTKLKANAKHSLMLVALSVLNKHIDIHDYS